MGFFDRLRSKFASGTQISQSQIGRGDPLGPWAQLRGMFEPRQVNPFLLEALREAVAPIDGGIGRLVTLDGIVAVEGGNDRLTAEIEDWMNNVVVGDTELGLQAFVDQLGGESYEQGCGIGEWVPDRRGRDIVALRVADTKGVHFRRTESELEVWYRPPGNVDATRRDGTHNVEAVLRNNFLLGASTDALIGAGLTQLDTDRLLYTGNRVEAGDPYGVSMIRSLEFVSQILLQLQNATGHVWSRYGDPPLSLTYKTKSRITPEKLAERRNTLATDLANTLAAKRKGNAADFVQAIGADDEITITVIGAQDQILEIEMPARHLLEQVVSKFGLPAWMLGFQWSTSERLAEQQSEVVLQESRTRWQRRAPYLTRLVATMLRLRGRSWKAGDWKLVQHLPNLHDELKRAQAGFLLAQTDLMLRGELNATPQPAGTDQGAAKSLTWPAPPLQIGRKSAEDGAEPFAEPDPELPALESRTIRALQGAWERAERQLIDRLGLTPAKREGELFEFTAQMLLVLQEIANQMEAEGADVLTRGLFVAWLRGVANAADDLDLAQVLTEIPAALREAIGQRGLQLVRNVVIRAMTDDVGAALAQGAFDGLNSTEVASRLRQRFSVYDYDWERLARSEITLAQSEGKQAEYQEAGVDSYDYVTMRDALVSSICREHERNGPYPVGGGPLPMRDSHPNCRCTTKPRVGE